MFLTFTVILAVSQVIIFLFPLLLKSPLRLDFTPLGALAILWIIRLFFYGKSGFLAAFGVILWIVFTLVGLLAVLSMIFTIGSFGDLEKKAAPVVFGNPDSLKTIAIIYHPGGSGLPKDTSTRVAQAISQKGIRVTLYTASVGLKINLQDMAAVGFISPVYGGSIRPPLANFINRTNLSGVKCFGIVTGWIQSAEARDLEKVKTLIESKGGTFIAGKKFTTTSINHPSEIDILVARIMEQL
jgi:hypothetical protein